MVNEIGRFSKGIAFIREHINKDMAFSQLAIFINVCLKEGLSMYDLADILEIPLASISRCTKELGKYMEKDPKTGEKRLAGYDLIRTEPDIEERRRLVLYLTPKGQKIKEELEKYLQV